MTIEDYKITFVGNTGSGKTSILYRFINDTYDKDMETTIGAMFRTTHIMDGHKTIKLQFWDTAGQERYRSIAPLYYKNTDCCIIVYDVTCKQSFDDIDYWIKSIKDNCIDNHVIIIIGNKIDMKTKRVISYDDACKYAKKHNIYYCEMSAKTCEGVKEFSESLPKLLKTLNKIHTPPTYIDYTQKKNYCCSIL
jgi:small GTP-binding protein